MAHLIIDLQHNQVAVLNGTPHAFNRRWESRVLALLLQTTQTAQLLSADMLQQTLLQHGQLKSLNRAQLQRILANIGAFMALLPGQPMRIVSAPRKGTVGPWHISYQAPVTFVVMGAADSAWHHPSLLQTPCIDQLHGLITDLLISDGFAVHGDYRSAIDALKPIEARPITAETRCMVWLREAMWQKRLGHFDTARDLALRAMALHTPADLGLQSHVSFFLQRIDYDESPASAAGALWHTLTEPPPVLSADWRTQAEWHNLRALVTRRRLLTLAHPAGHTETPATLHALAMRHLESAIYLGLWQRDWDRLQAYVANAAFHLQSIYGLSLEGTPDVQQVFKWHRLTLAYADKLDAARDSAWEYIFLGNFWLDHHAKLTAIQLSDPLAQEVEGSNPATETFYRQAVHRLRICGDTRQIAIGWTLYLRFAQIHMQGNAQRTALHNASSELVTLLTGQPKAVVQELQAEGYAKHWPEELANALMGNKR
jgi:hypothetical protein